MKKIVQKIRKDVINAIKTVKSGGDIKKIETLNPETNKVWATVPEANETDVDKAVKAADDAFNADWKNWITMVSRQVGLVDLADLIYIRSSELLRRQESRASFRKSIDTQNDENTTVQQTAVLFGEKEGRIAWANRGKDPLYLFAALQRQLGYPVVPKLKRSQPQTESPALLARRIDRLELRVKLLEEETKDGIDLSQFDPKNQPFKQPPNE